jgi:hypothetical protein
VYSHRSWKHSYGFGQDQSSQKWTSQTWTEHTHTHIYTYVYYIQYAQYLYSWFWLEQIWYIHIYSTADFIPKQFDFGNIGSLCVLNNITENQEPSLPGRMIPKRHLFYSEIHLDLRKMILYFFPWEIHYLGNL